MCGRYVIEDFQELSERLTNSRLPNGFLDSFRPTWNAAPHRSLQLAEFEALFSGRETPWTHNLSSVPYGYSPIPSPLDLVMIISY